MSQLKSRVEKLMSRINKSNSYAEIIKRHAGGDEGILVHTIMSLYITSNPEHKCAIKARNYLEWVDGQGFNAIPRAYSAIKDLISAGLATFAPREFISDGRDTSSMIPPYPNQCNPEQILNYADSKDTPFWSDLK